MTNSGRPWVSWVDFLLFALIIGSVVLFDWCAYWGGRSSSLEPMLTGLGMIFFGLVFGIGLALRPWMGQGRGLQKHQLWIRPVLLLCAWLGSSGVSRLNFFNDTGTTPFVTGCRDAVKDIFHLDDVEALRQRAHELSRAGSLEDDLVWLPIETLPEALRKGSWGDPRPVELRPHEGGAEIEVCWGGGHTGNFGLLIDPAKVPQGSADDSSYDEIRWYQPLAESVYFFYWGG
tara:strand:- start:241 stop:933 length:693 start_codon:yes stop_codon:yes gene_type:complete